MLRRTPLKRKTRLVAKTWLGSEASPRKRPRDTGPKKPIKDLVKDDRAKGVCERCGQRRGNHLHHRDPRGMGGSSRPEVNYASNLIFLCALCHLGVESDRLAATGDGYLIPDMYEMNQWNTPVRLWHGTYLLQDDGAMTPHKTKTEETT